MQWASRLAFFILAKSHVGIGRLRCSYARSFPAAANSAVCFSRENENGTLTPAAADLQNGYLTCTRSQGCYPSSRSAFLPSRLTSPGLIPGPTNSFPDTSATASASSPSFTGTLLRTNSMAPSLSDSYARKFRTIRGFPSESKVVTRMFHPAGILMRRNCRRSMTCLIQTDLVRHRGLIIPGLSPNESNAD
jgi:hypothetical protein